MSKKKKIEESAEKKVEESAVKFGIGKVCVNTLILIITTYQMLCQAHDETKFTGILQRNQLFLLLDSGRSSLSIIKFPIKASPGLTPLCQVDIAVLYLHFNSKAQVQIQFGPFYTWFEFSSSLLVPRVHTSTLFVFAPLKLSISSPSCGVTKESLVL